MSFSYVTGSVTGAYNNLGNSQSSLSRIVHQTPNAGSLLVITCSHGNSVQRTMSVSDNVNGSWTPVTTIFTGSGILATTYLQMFYIASAISSATTITLTLSGTVTGNIAWEVMEYSYVGGLAIDGTPANNSPLAVSSVATSGSVTTLKSPDLLVAMIITAVGNTSGTLSPYTSRNDTNAWNTATLGNNYNGVLGYSVEDQVGVSSGSQSATFSTGGATDRVIIGLTAFSAVSPLGQGYGAAAIDDEPWGGGQGAF